MFKIADSYIIVRKRDKRETCSWLGALCPSKHSVSPMEHTCAWGGRKQMSKPCTHVCQGINFHANTARARTNPRANPAPNTPAGCSRMAWFGLEDGVLVVPVVVLAEDTAEVMSGKTFQHCFSRTDNRYRLPEDGVVLVPSVCHGGFKNYAM